MTGIAILVYVIGAIVIAGAATKDNPPARSVLIGVIWPASAVACALDRWR